jgi:hypothetical protein
MMMRIGQSFKIGHGHKRGKSVDLDLLQSTIQVYSVQNGVCNEAVQNKEEDVAKYLLILLTGRRTPRKRILRKKDGRKDKVAGPMWCARP